MGGLSVQFAILITKYAIPSVEDAIPTDRNGIIGVKDCIISNNSATFSVADEGRDNKYVIFGDKTGVNSNFLSRIAI